MPIALPLSLDSNRSAIVPAPTACTDAAPPPLSIRIVTSIAIFLEVALNTAKIVNMAKDARYMVLRPIVSENALHQRGKMAIESIYNATDRLVTAAELPNSSLIWSRVATQCQCKSPTPDVGELTQDDSASNRCSSRSKSNDGHY